MFRNSAKSAVNPVSISTFGLTVYLAKTYLADSAKSVVNPDVDKETGFTTDFADSAKSVVNPDGN